jgi:hypothetical protein
MMNVYPGPDGSENLADKTLDQYILTYSSEQIQCSWDTDKYDILKDTLPKEPDNKLMDPLANDIGPANFNLGQAIRCVQNYAADHSIEADSLHLGQYTKGDYHKLVADLIDLKSPTTVSLVAYYLKEGVAFYTAVYGPNWQSADSQSQAAALVLFFKRGEQHILKGQASPASGYPPFLSTSDLLKSDGGPFVLRPDNWAKIVSALGIATSNSDSDPAVTPATRSDAGAVPDESPGAQINRSPSGLGNLFHGFRRWFTGSPSPSTNQQAPVQTDTEPASGIRSLSNDTDIPMPSGSTPQPWQPDDTVTPPILRPILAGQPPPLSGLSEPGVQNPFTPITGTAFQNSPAREPDLFRPTQIIGPDLLHPILGESDTLYLPTGEPPSFVHPPTGTPDFIHTPAAAPSIPKPPMATGIPNLLHSAMAEPPLLGPLPGGSGLGHPSMVGPSMVESAPKPAEESTETAFPGIPRTGGEGFGEPPGMGAAASEGSGPSALQFGRPLITESAFESRPTQEQEIPEGEMGAGDFEARGGGEV